MKKKERRKVGTGAGQQTEKLPLVLYTKKVSQKQERGLSFLPK